MRRDAMTHERIGSFAALLVFAACSLFFASNSSAADTDLTGLWRAKRVSAGLAHVRLIVSRSGDDYRADMLGMDLPIKNESGILTFGVTNGEGRFRGRITKN